MKNLLFLLLLFPILLTAQIKTFTNPIVPGGYPDPSICRVGADFYIVNSSFEYYPGLPIHHSKDLVNWELIGYGLDRPEQCQSPNNLVDVQQRGGIHAPTIRHHDGLFYIITTNVYTPKDKSKPTDMVNFIITAENPAGPWSMLHRIEGAPGIDPDLFFDDDGKVYFVGTHDTGNPNKNGIGEIWIQELDLDNWVLKGARHSVWTGACGGCCVEGPHLYKQHGKYYLMIAEGGTGYNHAVMIAASEELTGPYEPSPRNPILTSRHLSQKNWVHSTGHADLVELADGRWYMVALGKRNDEEGHSNMGRETHLIPVVWESSIVRWREVTKGNWQPLEYLFPVCAPETGKVERINPLPFADKPQYNNDGFTDNFDSEKLHLEWNFRRVPRNNTYSLTEKMGHLRLQLQPEVIQLRERYSIMGVRQKESDFEYSASMYFEPKKEKAEAGVSIFQQDDNYIMWTVVKEEKDAVLQLKVHKKEEQSAVILKKEVLSNYNGQIQFKITSKNDRYNYEYSLDDGKTFISFAESAPNFVISLGYTGAYVGVYATSNGQTTTEYADFDWVTYKGYQR